MRQSLILMTIVLGVLFFSGCESDCIERGTCECITRYDCAEAEICVDGACIENDKQSWVVPVRLFGEPCIDNRECVDGYCLPLGPRNGGVCTRVCDADNPCATGWNCRAWTGPVVNADAPNIHVCVQESPSKLCMTCGVDGHCNATGDLCIELGDAWVCGQDCSIQTCPLGYLCGAVERESMTYAQCQPIGDSCDCGPGRVGMVKGCERSNTHGVCGGWTSCEQRGSDYAWSDCDAREPAQEICNGIDDDCDGLIDAFDPSLSHEGIGDERFPLCALGGCVGKWQCRGGVEEAAWVCDAGDPEREICNGADDNCDGRIDEPFVDADGNYVHVEHCGGCGINCAEVLTRLKRDADGQIVENAVECRLSDGQSRCVPLVCEDGYYPYPHESPTLCMKLESASCQACAEDKDCRVYSDQCVSVAGDIGKHCLQSCSSSAPYTGCTGQVGVQSCCPESHSCERYEGALRCLPIGGSCTCDVTKLGMQRNCVATSDTDICQGRQRCEERGSGIYVWSECSADELTKEVCDGQDNNCDGRIDETFVDEKGRYNTEAHCGACNEDCPSRWKAKELHAEGACLLAESDYSCQFTKCKLELVDAGKRCSTDLDCGAEMRCDRQMFFCVSTRDEISQRKCKGDEDCTTVDRAQRCIEGVCKLRVQYHNVNAILADGCECGEAIDGGGDDPDIFNEYPDENSVYVDRNCDGVDGDVATSLFVNAQSQRSLGTLDNPYKTIAEAVEAYKPTTHTGILVAAGSYHEQVVLKSGVRLYGGYSADFRDRNIVLNPTQILGPVPVSETRPGTVFIPTAARRTILSGFTVVGYDVLESAKEAAAGRNSFAVFVQEGNSNIILTNNAIIGGRAGDGGRGIAGESGNPGGNGINGRNSRECNDAYCLGLTTPGGGGGANSACKAADGRPGAMAQDGAKTQLFANHPYDGYGGANNSYDNSNHGYGQYCKYDCLVGGYSNGGDGKNGDDGQNGQGGMGCQQKLGAQVGTTWLGGSSNAGSFGGAARGGGGGGAGGGAINRNAQSSCIYGSRFGDIGASGGGGGAGGCGAGGGTGGGSGGGSFGIWFAQASGQAQVRANKIRLGTGGSGGAGGAGGAGGHGGIGGVGGKPVEQAWCAGGAGSGGAGGDGGGGGGGGGGCGGVSIGIAGASVPDSYSSANRFEYPNNDPNAAVGLGGIGGSSPAGNSSYGGSGTNGQTAFVHAFK